MYIAAEEIHSSGVLAVVSGGLFLSRRRNSFLSSASRLRGVNVWESFVFVLNGLVFLLIGLDLPQITAGLGGVGITRAIGYGLLITGVLIVVRIIAAYGAVVTTLIMRNFITVADRRSPGLRTPLILGWSGMRGVVSLAAALSIPAYLPNGEAFPQRNLILFISFIVILTTLILQGLTLPYLIKKIQLPVFDDYYPEEDSDIMIRKELSKQSLQHLSKNHNGEVAHSPLLQQLTNKWRDDSNVIVSPESKKIYQEILEVQRQWLLAKNKRDNHMDEDIIRKHLRQIDVEEEKLRFF
jgi:CPA1 family monovalent cation:H+ antiporter